MPKTESTLLKAAIILTCILWTALAARLVFVNGFTIVMTTIGLLLVALSVGLWSLKRWALSLSKFLLGAIVVLVMLGTFGPFYGLDHPAGGYGDETPWSDVLVGTLPIVVGGIVLFGVLDRFKEHFRPRPQPVPESDTTT